MWKTEFSTEVNGTTDLHCVAGADHCPVLNWIGLCYERQVCVKGVGCVAGADGGGGCEQCCVQRGAVTGGVHVFCGHLHWPCRHAVDHYHYHHR